MRWLRSVNLVSQRHCDVKPDEYIAAPWIGRGIVVRKDEYHLNILDNSLDKFHSAGLIIEDNVQEGVLHIKDDLLLTLSHTGLPDKYNPWRDHAASLPFDMRHFPTYLRVVEYISRADASCLLALPGTSLACRAVLLLGDDAQQEHFFSRFLTQPSWTFFAVSEPEVGSDAASITTRLESVEQGLTLTGSKMFIGGAQIASIGLVFARHGDRTQLIMVEPQQAPEAITVEPLAAYGLAGAGLSRITFDAFPVQPEQILGLTASPLRQGINALTQVFEKHRPLVAAMALGTARGFLEALAREDIHEKDLWRQYHSLYARLMEVGEHFHQERSRVWQTSQIKRQATAFVERVAHRLPHRLPTEYWVNQPGLMKRYRDAFAFEYMEGTSNIHLLNGWRGFLTGKEKG
ncbi:acyl-CoA dehydrogenase family protein [Lonsdalea quercina]|uniref:acyl-CoA dehydrogenase family protein n=1 Tax=Lonsdalea quercina TaxID=71657 RepID=UPI00397695B0